MKKTYQNPTTKVIEIELQQMIAMSALGTTQATSGNLSREGSAWDDDDEE